MATTPDPSLEEPYASTFFTEPTPYTSPYPLIEGQNGFPRIDQPGLLDPALLDPRLFDNPEPPFEEWNGFTSLIQCAPSDLPGPSFEERHGFRPITGPPLHGHSGPSSGEWQF